MAVTDSDRGMSGNGYLMYRKPDQLRLIVLSPFGSVLTEFFANGERITIIHPSDSIAYTGRIEDLPDREGLQGWRLMRWIMDAEPAASVDLNGSIERTGRLGTEVVTYENGLITSKRTSQGDRVYYSRYAVYGGVPFAAEIDLRNSRDDRIRLVVEEPEINTVLDDNLFRPRLDGMTLYPLSRLNGL